MALDNTLLNVDESLLPIQEPWVIKDIDSLNKSIFSAIYQDCLVDEKRAAKDWELPSELVGKIVVLSDEQASYFPMRGADNIKAPPVCFFRLAIAPHHETRIVSEHFKSKHSQLFKEYISVIRSLCLVSPKASNLIFSATQQDVDFYTKHSIKELFNFADNGKVSIENTLNDVLWNTILECITSEKPGAKHSLMPLWHILHNVA